MTGDIAYSTAVRIQRLGGDDVAFAGYSRLVAGVAGPSVVDAGNSTEDPNWGGGRKYAIKKTM